MTELSLKGRLLTAAENAIVSYVQLDGTNWKQGEILPKEETDDFIQWVKTSTKAALGEGSEVELSYADEQSITVSASQNGETASTMYRWEKGGFFDLDGDGELG